ncbi:MAG: glycosyltransferase family 4 protein, partial [Microthrixaceae bacterium]
MRVGLVCPYSLSFPGGVQGQVLALASSLRRRGVEARVLAPCDGPPPETFVIPLGKSVPTASNGSVAPVAPDPAAQLRTIRALWDEEFDVVHLHEPLAPGPTVTTLLLRPAPLVGTFHAAGSQPAYTALAPLVRWGAERLDRRVAVSEDARDLAAGHLGGEYELLFNGVEVHRFATASPWPDEGRPTVLFLGRHEPRKGLEVLLRAVPQLPADARVWVAGTGPATEELRARYTDPRIEWLGRIDDAERDRRLAGATVFCAPSLGGESFGIILLEAMAAGTPVVASAIEGYAKVATAPGPDGVSPAAPAAVLVEPDDPSALGAALADLLGDPDRAAAQAELGR